MESPAVDDDNDPSPPANACPRPPRLPLPSAAVPSSSSRLEIRLFYVRIAPCASDAVPAHITLSHLRRDPGVSLEINGSRVPSSDLTSIPLRRDRLDRDAAEVTYVSTDRVRLTGASDFSVSDESGNLILCGSLERMEAPWSNGAAIHTQGPPSSDSKTGWSISCYSAASTGASAFVQPRLGISSPSIEVYVAGCFAGFPLILTQTVQLSPRRRVARLGGLVAIPEDDESSGKEQALDRGLHHLRTLSSSSAAEGETDEFDSNMKLGHCTYPEGWYVDDDGQLSWFNAGVRVGVGIGLGMCVGIGIGVGLLMRSYQATTRGLRRRFF